ncbi:hypothetical protein GOP47_0009460 [Adiantum capillus-veneris]|uniref:Uncharacterized protein n=1 Tax=Adiantum capillus-veneris TaxID=13818 RepID=A0A9D4ZH85_ADICA|nr:hypothetical protein GOP47_0009460 [Adiantum capillus-veneris]
MQSDDVHYALHVSPHLRQSTSLFVDECKRRLQALDKAFPILPLTPGGLEKFPTIKLSSTISAPPCIAAVGRLAACGAHKRINLQLQLQPYTGSTRQRKGDLTLIRPANVEVHSLPYVSHQQTSILYPISGIVFRARCVQLSLFVSVAHQRASHEGDVMATLDRTTPFQDCSRQEREIVANELELLLWSSKEMESAWKESHYYLFGKSKEKTTYLDIWIDDDRGWDGNLQLLLLKKTLKLIDYYVIRSRSPLNIVSNNTIQHRMDVLESIIPLRRLIVT